MGSLHVRSDPSVRSLLLSSPCRLDQRKHLIRPSPGMLMGRGSNWQFLELSFWDYQVGVLNTTLAGVSSDRRHAPAFMGIAVC